MSVLKLSKNDINEKRDDNKIKLNKSQISYDSAMVSGWETTNKEALNTLNNYYTKLNNNEWLSADDISAYRKALDSYIDSSTRLRKLNKSIGSGHDEDEEKKWTDSITSMNSTYDSVSKLHSAFKSAEDYDLWYKKETFIDAYLKDAGKATTELEYDYSWLKEADRRKEESTVKNYEDFEEYSQRGADIKNPSYREAEGWFSMGNWRPFGEDIGNIVTFSRDNIGDIEAQMSQVDNNAQLSTILGDYRYQFMEEDEVAVYNYYLGKGDIESAEKYLSSLDDSLNQRYGGMIAENAQNANLEWIMNIATGLDQWASGAKNTLNFITGDEANTTSPIQYAGAEIREDIDSDFWRGVWDLGVTVSNQLPSILVGSITGGVGGLITMGSSVLGNSYAEMRNLGYGEWESRGYAALVTAAEVGLQSVLGGISSLGGSKSLSKMAVKALDSVDNGIARVALKLGTKMAGEAVEESAQSVLEPIFKRIFTGDWEGIDWGEVAYSGLLGALSAGMLESVGTVVSDVKTTNAGKEVLKSGAVNRLAELGKTTFSANTVANQIAGKVNESTGAYKIGRLFQEVGATLSEQNKADIIAGLEEKGVPHKQAKKLAEQYQAFLNGEMELTDEQVAVFENCDPLTAAIREKLIKENLTSFQMLRESVVGRESDSYKRAREYEDILNLVYGENKSADAPTAKSAPYAVYSEEGFARALEGETTTESNGLRANYSKGKTTLVSTGEEVTIKEISSIKGKKVYVSLDDGREVSIDDIDFSNESEGLIYEAVASMNPETAKDLIDGFNQGNIGEGNSISLENYLRGFNEAYRYGSVGIPVTEMSRNGFSAELSDAQKNIAYNRGKIDSVAKAKAKQAVLDAKKAALYETGNVGKKKGKVHFDKVNKHTLTDRQKASVKTLNVVAEALGVDIVLFESPVNEKGKRIGENGSYDPTTNTIRIDMFAGMNGEATMLFTAAHELTHFIREWSPTKFKVFADFLLEQYGKKGISVETLIQNQITKAKKNGRNISYDTAYEEVIADSCEAMLTDSNAIEKLAKLKAKDKGLFNKIKSFITKLVARIKAAYEGLNPDSEEANHVREMVDAAEKLQALWTEALVDAGETYQTIGSRDLSELSEAKTTDGKELFQYRAMEVDKDDYRAMLLKHGLMTNAEIDNLFSMIDKALDVIKNNLEALDYAWDVDINDRAFMPVKPNSDKLYAVSLDFSTLCRKRLLQQTIQATLQEALNKPLSKEEGIAIRDELMKIQEEGRQIEIACALCYVESARMKSPAQIKKFLKNRESVLIDFFAGRAGGSTSEKIKQAEADARAKLHKENPNGISGKNGTIVDPRTASLSKMMAKYADQIRKAKKDAKLAYKPTPNEQKMIDAVKGMKTSDFTSPEGLENLAKNYSDIFDAYTSFVRNATHSKGIEKDTWWRAGDSDGLIGQALIDRMNAENGLRSQSWSDFQVIHLLDYIAATIELSTKNAKRQSYTKVADYVILLGNTGDMINMSLIPMAKYNGKLEYDSVEGIDYKTSLELRDKYHATAGTICIGIDNAQIKQLLADGTIDYVIPYHKSSMSQATKKLMHIPSWFDYEPYQSESVLSSADAKENAKKYGVELLDKSDKNYNKSTKFSDWFDLKEAQQIAKMENANPSDPAMRKKYGVMYGAYKAMQNAANNYLKLCAERGLSPKFSHENADFTDEENYWKLLIDRKMVDNVTGEIIEQKAIKPVFDEADVLGILNRELEKYPQVKADQEYATRKVVEKFLSGDMKVDKDTREAIKKTVDNVTVVNIEASSDGLKLSDRDSSWRDVDKIQGLEDYSVEEVTDIVRQYIEDIAMEIGEEISIIDIRPYGSRSRGTAKKSSDLDVVVQYEGDIREDDMFNMLNDVEDKLSIDGIEVDINPIKADDTGAIEEYLDRVYGYDKYSETKYSDRGYEDNEFIKAVNAEAGEVKKTGNWRGNYLAELYKTHPELDFIKRIGNADIGDSTAIKEFTDLVATISDKNLLQNLLWYPIYVRDSQFRGIYRKAINAYKKVINNRIAEVIGGKKIGFEARSYDIHTIRELFNSLNSNSDISILADKVFNLAERLGLEITGVTKFDKKGTVGRSSGDKIQYLVSFMNDTTVTDINKAVTILHELIHACTTYAINAVVLQNSPKYIDVYVSNGMRKAVATLGNIYAQIKGDKDFKGYYGITDAKEMVAELSNPAFREQLKKKNLWSMIVDAIKRIFGIETKTALDGVSTAVDYILDNFDAEAYNAHIGKPNASSDKSVKYSDRYSYETLISKPDMKIATIGGTVPTNRADVVAQAKKNASAVGKINKNGSVSVYVDDVGVDVILGTDGLKHSLRRVKDAQNDPNYIVTLNAGEILKNSIRINELTPSKSNATGSYILIGAAKGTSGDLYIVRSIVNQFNHELDSMDVLYAMNAKKELAATKSPRSTENPLSVTNSTISIAELLENVNSFFPDILPESVLRHFGYDARPLGQLGEDALYSDRDLAPTFYSQMGKVVDGMKQDKFAASSVVSMFRGRGVKAEEIRWSGIATWLEGKKSVTKQELQEFIAGSQLQIGEQMSGGDVDLRYNAGERSYTLYDKEGNVIDTYTYNEFMGGYVSELDDEIYSNANELEDAVREEYGEMSSPRWSQYKLDGGSNYREIVFTLPNSTYSNRAMKGHWGQDAEGVLVHARIQDFVVNGKKMLFIEELQSDWHNEGHSKGYSNKEYEDAVETHDKLYNEYKKMDLAFHKYVRSNEFMTDPEDVRKKKHDWLRGKVDTAQKKYLDAEKVVNSLKEKGAGDTPDAPFKDTYHEYVLKRLLRMAAEQGYDSIGWTPAEIQSKRWSYDYEKGYRIEYDQEMPKFMSKYGRQWGAKVEKSNAPNGEDIWSMDLTDSMKDSVLHEGQVLYSDRDPNSVSNRSLLANALESAVQNDIERNKLTQYKEKIDLINSEEAKLHELNGKIRDILFSKGARDSTKLRDLQFEAKQTANRINTYDRQLLTLEASKPLKAVLEREKKLAYEKAEKEGVKALLAYREKAAKTTRELMNRYQESRARATEGRHKTEYRHKIKKVVGDLNKLLLRPTKDKHIKEGLKVAVAEALSVINMDTVGAEERIARLDELIAKANDPNIIAELTATRDRIEVQGENLKDKLTALQTAYEKIKNSTDPELKNAYQEPVMNAIKNVVDVVGNTSIREMSLTQLDAVYEMYSMILHTVRTANKAFKAKKGETITQISEAVNDEIRKISKEKFTRNPVIAGLRKVGWTLLKPLTAFRTIGSDTFTGLYNELRNGEDVFYVDINEAKTFIQNQYKKHNFKSWDQKQTKTFTAKSGKTFTLTLEQMMSLYAYSRRDQAYDHIIEGGIVLEDSVIETKNKLGLPVKYKVDTKSAFNISEETLAEICDSLTAEQKGFVEEMQAYLSDVMGAKGNEVSMELLGVQLFKEKFYFPLKSSKYYMGFKPEEAGEIKLKNPAFSKETVQHANNPVVLKGFTDVWATHINDMSMYHAFVLPLEDFTRVYNYKTKTDALLETMSTEATIANAFGEGATQYIRNFLRSLNGGVRTESVGIADKAVSLSKKGAVLGSASVMIQQPSAIMRAMALINPIHFVASTHKSINLVKHNKDWAELKQYAPIAGIKEMGRFDVGMGQSTVKWIKDQDTILEKADEILSQAPAFMDEVTWVGIWNAVKNEVKHKHKDLVVGSEAYLKKCGERFTEVVSLTQVYDSVFSRSDIMRNQSWIAKALTAFMAEPSTTLNMLVDSFIQGKRTGKVGGFVKVTAGTSGAIVGSIVLNAALKSIITAMRDDDEDESYVEKYLGAFVGNATDDLNPLSYIPFVKDIVSIFNGYDVERMDMALFSDLKYAIDAFDSDSKTEYEKWTGLIGAISAFAGIPFKNVERDIRGAVNTIKSFSEGEKTTGAGIKNSIRESLTGKETSNTKQLYEAYLSDDKEQIKRVEGRFEDKSDIESALRKALRENDSRINEAAQAVIDGNHEERIRLTREIIAEGHFKQDIVIGAINAELTAIKRELNEQKDKD